MAITAEQLAQLMEVIRAGQLQQQQFFNDIVNKMQGVKGDEEKGGGRIP